MRWAAFAVFAFGFLVLEVSLGHVLELRSIGNVAPSLVAILAVFVSLFAPRLGALWACWILGLVLDLSSEVPHGSDRVGPFIGPYALGYPFAAFLLIQLRAMLFRNRALTVAVMAGLFVTASSVVAVCVYLVQSWYPGEELHWAEHGPGFELLHRLGVAIYTGLFALLLARPLMWTLPWWTFRSGVPRR